ncbi:hypothetical protein ASC93_23880 [Massilia sp. Root335]|nr:hypothetical protein ASC93_23880 [Massilia sp. Root335]
MGPHRDLIGDLGAAVRKAGLRFGVSNHGVENFTFVNPTDTLDARLRTQHADLYDATWAGFYNVADRSPQAMARFLSDWLARNFELIDKYQPDLLYFDNGVNLRVLDPLNERVAAYYYNRAADWGKDVSIVTKWVAYAPDNDDRHQIGAVIGFEKVGTRSPSGIRPGPWMVDDTIGSTWGYTDRMTIGSAGAILGKLIDTVSKGGFYLLNIALNAGGTIPDDQRAVLLEIGAWLKRNGEAIYGTHAWTRFGDGDWRFTVKDGALYAIGRPSEYSHCCRHLFSLTAATRSHQSPPPILTYRRHPVLIHRRQSFSSVTATRAREISRIFQMSKMLSSMANGRVRPGTDSQMPPLASFPIFIVQM